MTKLERRDRRRAYQIAAKIDSIYWVGGVDKFDKSRDLIAAALKREREDAGPNHKPTGCDCDLLEQPGSPPVCNEFRSTPNNPAFCLVCQHVEECHA